MTRRKAVVAMSGGVDSSVAAARLVEAGFDVTGIMLKLWRGEAANSNSGCCNVGAADDAARVADVLGIRFYVLNHADRFERTVIRDFHETYAAGRTPNPCVRCNHWIKFDAMLEAADAIEADVIATGHYARVERREGTFSLLRGRDRNKDQSYVLWMLGQERLRRLVFPVGDLTKPQTRAVAETLGLRTANKPDSQEICFVRGGDLRSYAAERIPSGARPGPILDRAGKVVGEHAGVAAYTVGQRKGLGISLGVPVFVTAIDPEANAIRVGDRSDLAVGGLSLAETSFVGEPLAAGDRVLVQHRAHGDAAPARVEGVAAGALELAYERPVDAVAPGQSAALYSDDNPDELLGGGIVRTTVPARSAA